MWMQVAGSILGIGGLGLAAFAGYMGLFSKMKVKVQKEEKERVVLFANLQGALKDIGNQFDKLMVDMGKSPELVEFGIMKINNIGLYFDDPYQLKSENDMRYAIGMFLPEEIVQDQQKLDKVVAAMKGLGYQKGSLPIGEYVVGEWPYKNVLSFMIGPMKFYPTAHQFLKDNGMTETISPALEEQCKTTAGIEIYDMSGYKTIFQWPVTNAVADQLNWTTFKKPEYKTQCK